jgi:predicted nucleic acid-binding protein
MKYLFDTNIFIRSKNEMPMDIWPTFWNTMTEMIISGKVFISVKVKEEIEKGKDELTEWIKTSAPKSCYIPIDGDVTEKYVETQRWAASQPFNEPAKLVFAEVADAFIVATAAAKDMTLVTYEKSDPFSRKRVMIPDACRAIGANSCDLNAALREMGIQI